MPTNDAIRQAYLKRVSQEKPAVDTTVSTLTAFNPFQKVGLLGSSVLSGINQFINRSEQGDKPMDSLKSGALTSGTSLGVGALINKGTPILSKFTNSQIKNISKTLGKSTDELTPILKNAESAYVSRQHPLTDAEHLKTFKKALNVYSKRDPFTHVTPSLDDALQRMNKDYAREAIENNADKVLNKLRQEGMPFERAVSGSMYGQNGIRIATHPNISAKHTNSYINLISQDPKKDIAEMGEEAFRDRVNAMNEYLKKQMKNNGLEKYKKQIGSGVFGGKDAAFGSFDLRTGKQISPGLYVR